MPEPISETDSIEEAYQDHIKDLYRVLVTGLASLSVGHDTEQQCVGRFAAGVQLSKKARDLALGVLAAAPKPRA